MASTPQTSGFQVSVMPGFQLANPAYFDPYSRIAQGLQSGVNIGSQLSEIANRRRQQEEEMALAPMRIQLLQAQLAKAQQQAAIPDIVWGDTTDVDTSRTYPAAVDIVRDEQGNPVLGNDGQPVYQPTGEPSIEYGDIVRTSRGIQYLPGGGTAPIEKKTTLKLAADREIDELNKRSLMTQREAAAQAARDRIAQKTASDAAKNALDERKVATAEQVAAYKMANPKVKTKTFYDAENNVFEQIVNDDGSLGEAVQVILPTGQPAKRPQPQNPWMIAPAPVVSGTDPLKSKVKQESGTGGILEFGSIEQAEAAGNSGRLKKGTKIIIAGRPATWQ